jgi:hypothetical protein
MLVLPLGRASWALVTVTRSTISSTTIAWMLDSKPVLLVFKELSPLWVSLFKEIHAVMDYSLVLASSPASIAFHEILLG